MNSNWRRALSILLSFVLTVGLAGSGPGLSLAAQAAEASYSVMLTGGENASASGGSTVQEGLTGEMEAVTFTANEGYYFEEFEDITNNGITAAWTNETEVTVSGTPAADAAITIPDAVEKKEAVEEIAESVAEGTTEAVAEEVEESVKEGTTEAPAEETEEVEEAEETVAEGTTKAPAEETEEVEAAEETVAEGTTEAPAKAVEPESTGSKVTAEETEITVAPETITVEESAKAEEATTATEWHVGDTINLAGKYFYTTNDSSVAVPSANKDSEVPEPEYNQWSGRWMFKNCIVDAFASNDTIEPDTPFGRSFTPIGFKVKEGDGSSDSPYKFEVVYAFGVALSPYEKQTISLRGKVRFDATVVPLDAEDRSVKWSIGGTNADAVKLYSDEACTTEVGTEATETLTVYAKGISPGTASITVTGNADSTKTKSCDVEVTNSYDLWVGEKQVSLDNYTDVLGNGTVKFDPETNTLTLNNATITDTNTADYDTACICSFMEDLIIELKGENQVGATEEEKKAEYTIDVKNLTIQGEGTLDVVGSSCAIYSYGTTTISGGEVTATGQYAMGAANIVLSGNSTKIDATMAEGSDGFAVGAWAENAKIELNDNLAIVTPENATTGTAVIYEWPYVVVKDSKGNAADHVIIEAVYDVTKAEAKNGSFTVSSEKALAGDEITVTATPDEGYAVDKMTYTADGKVTDFTSAGKFTMPASDITVSVTFKKAISRTVTFKVVNGSWNDGTTAAKTVTLTGYEGDTLKLTSDQIPAVGSKPNTGYKAGSWDVKPGTGTAITKDTTYTYTYAKNTRTGWQTIKGKRYYYTKEGKMVTGWKTISGKRYYFADSKWKGYTSSKKGMMLTGWKTISGKLYYFADSRCKGFKSSAFGVRMTGWKTISGRKYYFVDSQWKGYKASLRGIRAYGWKTINGKMYYFMDARCKGYTLSKKGVMVTGWKTISGKKYYFDKSGVLTKK